jgi:hypothetical protein
MARGLQDSGKSHRKETAISGRGEEPPTLKKVRLRKRGGHVPGKPAKSRPDRRARGGATLNPTTAGRADGGSLLRAVGTGDPIKGVGQILGLPGDMYHVLDQGSRWALTKGAEKLGLITPEEGESLRQPLDPALGSEAITRHLKNLQAGDAGDDGSGANILAPSDVGSADVPQTGRRQGGAVRRKR